MSVFSIENLNKAYLDCRKNKRNKTDALMFEVNSEEYLRDLSEQLNERSYHPSTSLCFVARRPKIREIFAAQFKDRIIHHLIVRYLEKTWEPLFIFDSYASRKGKGIHLAVKRLKRFIGKATCNGTRNAFYMQLDIKSFFMRIDKDILFERIQKRCHNDDMTWLIKTVLYHNPIYDYDLRTSRFLLAKVPQQKSLFSTERNRGLPIGNLTSQFFANVYLNGLDRFVKHTLTCRYYMRYVDDFVFVDPDMDRLVEWKPLIVNHLREKHLLELNEKRTKICPVSNGIDFLGYIVRKDYMLIRNRVVNNLKEKLRNYERKLIKTGDGFQVVSYNYGDLEDLFASINSYLGHFKHGNAYWLTQSIFEKRQWLRHFFRLENGRLQRLYVTPKKIRRIYSQYLFYQTMFSEHVMFFQIGCFYEFFGRQATWAIETLNLKLIKRKYGFTRRCGIGQKAKDKFIKKALEHVSRVIVIEQAGYYRRNIEERRPDVAYIRLKP